MAYDRTLIVADPRQIWLARHADVHLQLRPGTDVWLLNAMAHVIIGEDLVDHDFIAKHTAGFEAVREAVKRYPPDRVGYRVAGPSESYPIDAKSCVLPCHHLE